MAKKSVSAKRILGDVLCNMDDWAIMNKYGLTAKQLDSVLRKLVEAGLITQMQLYERTTLTDSTITKAFQEEGMPPPDWLLPSESDRTGEFAASK